MCQPSLFVLSVLSLSFVFQNTDVEERGEDCTYERSHKIEPDVRIVTADNSRSQRPCGVERSSRQWTTHQDAKYQREPDRESREVPCLSTYGSIKNRIDEEEGEYDFDDKPLRCSNREGPAISLRG